MKSRYSLAILLIIFLSVLSCKKNKIATLPKVDPVAQAVIDNDSLVQYLETHYLNADGNIWTINNGERPLFDDVQTQDISYNDVSYKMYYLLLNEGTTIFPKRSDSILVNYSGFLLDSTKFDSRLLTWIDLTQVVEGWKYGFVHFKGGDKVINADESISYNNTGNGFLFFPSGLGYKDVYSGAIPINSPLIFKIELNQVEKSDHDNDGVLSYLEDVDGNGEVTNDDTDVDGIANYLDIDDDGDTILTRDEDLNKNGNWFDDDTDGDGTPNFLDNDDDGDGKLTKDEDANHNGDLFDDDTDGDGIPNFLDQDS